MNCTCSTCFFTNTASNTTDFTLFTCNSSFFFVRAFYYNVVCTFVNLDQVLWTDFCTLSTGNTFFFVYFGNAIFIQGNCAKFTFFYTGSTSDAAIFASTVFRAGCAAATVTGNQSCPVRKSLFNCHDYFFLSYGVLERGRL